MNGRLWAGPNDHPFKGAINGNNHTTSNLEINSDGQNIGFVGWETFSRVVNLNIVSVKIAMFKE